MVISSSSCENTGSFWCSWYRRTQSRPSFNQSGMAKLTASFRLSCKGEVLGGNK